MEPDPMPLSISESPVPLTEEALRSLNRNTDENSKSFKFINELGCQ